MYNPTDTPAGGDVVRVLLHGGPVDLPEAQRVQWVPAAQQTIKILYGSGYEHFERDVEPAGPGMDAPVVFRWHTRTRIAE